MKTILVPTDFSPGAETITELAVQIAQAMGAKIVLLHSYSVMPPEPMQPGYDIAALEQTVREYDEAQLAAIRTKIKDQFGFDNLDTLARPGFAVEEIISTSEDLKADLIVQATLGAEGLERALFGSNSALVLEQAQCPVLVVPADRPMRKMDKLIYAVDFGSFKAETLQQLAPLAAALKANVQLVHVARPDAPNLRDLETQLAQLAEQSPIASTTSSLFLHEDAFEGLKVYMSIVTEGVLVMHTKKRSFFQKFFKPSLTKKLAYEAEFPLLALHSK